MRADHPPDSTSLFAAWGGIGVRATAWMAVLGVLIVASLVPPGLAPDEIPSLVWNVGHAPGYALLTLLSLWLAHGTPERRPVVIVLIVLGVFALGVVLELLQPLFNRYADARDVAVNALGIALAICVWSLAVSPAGGRLIDRMRIHRVRSHRQRLNRIRLGGRGQ